MSCGVGRRLGSDPMLLWLWLWLAPAAPIRPLAWEPPYATRCGPRKDKKTKKKDSQIFFFVYLVPDLLCLDNASYVHVYPSVLLNERITTDLDAEFHISIFV